VCLPLTFYKYTVKQAQTTSIRYTNLRRIFENEFVTDLRFELGVKDSAAEAELVLVVLQVLLMLNSRSCKKADGFAYGYSASLLLLDNPRLEELQRAEHRFLLLHPEACSSDSEA
jgi:hypothetical protein